jgi:hypothetical protein
MIVDIPEGLPVPMVSSPPTSVPEWNSNNKSFLAMGDSQDQGITFWTY